MFETRRLLVAILAVMVFGTMIFGTTAVLFAEEGTVPETEAEAIEIIKSDAPVFNKMLACKRLAVCGTKEAVPALAAMLSDKKLAHYARYALEPIPDPSVDVVLRDAMGRLKGNLLIGVINSIGKRQDVMAIGSLTELLATDDPTIIAASAAALSRIGTPETAETLQKALTNTTGSVRASIGDACIKCGETLLQRGHQAEAIALLDATRKADLPKHIVVAATRGAILARGADGVALMVEQLKSKDDAMFGIGLRTAREIESDDVAKALVALLGDLPAQRQALAVVAIADRGDLDAVLEASKSDNAAVRLAAIEGLSLSRDPAAVPVLLDAAIGSDPTLSKAAKATLVAMPGSSVDEAVVAAMGQDDKRVQLVAIEAVGARAVVSALPKLIEAADSDDETLRIAAIGALGTTISMDQFALLTDRLVNPNSDAERKAVEVALQAAAIRVPNREACAKNLIGTLSGGSTQVKIALFDLLGAVGGQNALKALAAGAKDSDDKLQDAATRVLGTWMSTDAAPLLLDLAKTHPTRKYRVRALRGYIRIARQLKMPKEERIAMCRRALVAAERDQEKTLARELLQRIQ